MRHSLLALSLLLVLVSPAEACPNCEITAELPRSVRSARNIYLGRVVRALNKDQAEIEVVKVLRGPLKKGQLVKVHQHDRKNGIQLFDAKGMIGKLLLLSDPTSVPRYPVLEPEFEDEVRFLMKRPRITSVALAVRLVQGISDVASAAGLAHIRRQRKEAPGPLIEAIDRLKSDLFSGRARYWDWVRLRQLVHALVNGVDAGSPGHGEVRAYVLLEVKGFLSHTWGRLEIKAVRDSSDHASVRELTSFCVRGQFLAWLLSNTKKKSALREEVHRRVERAYRALGGEGIACVRLLVLPEL